MQAQTQPLRPAPATQPLRPACPACNPADLVCAPLLQIGPVKVGSEHPIALQTMTTTDTRDVEKTVEQVGTGGQPACSPLLAPLRLALSSNPSKCACDSPAHCLRCLRKTAEGPFPSYGAFLLPTRPFPPAPLPQVKRCSDAGADIVRITVQGKKEAEACMRIRERLFQDR